MEPWASADTKLCEFLTISIKLSFNSEDIQGSAWWQKPDSFSVCGNLCCMSNCNFFFSWSSRLISIFRHYSLLVVFPLFFCHSHMSSVGNAFGLLHGKIMLFFKTKLRLWGASLLKWGFLFDSNPSVQFSNYLIVVVYLYWGLSGRCSVVNISSLNLS